MRLKNTTRTAIKLPSGHTIEPGGANDVPTTGDNAAFLRGQVASGRLSEATEAKPDRKPLSKMTKAEMIELGEAQNIILTDDMRADDMREALNAAL